MNIVDTNDYQKAYIHYFHIAYIEYRYCYLRTLPEYSHMYQDHFDYNQILV